jgi:hypothetical protein
VHLGDVPGGRYAAGRAEPAARSFDGTARSFDGTARPVRDAVGPDPALHRPDCG